MSAATVGFVLGVIVGGSVSFMALAILIAGDDDEWLM